MSEISGNVINNAKRIFYASTIALFFRPLTRKAAAGVIFDPHTDDHHEGKMVVACTSLAHSDDLFIFVNHKGSIKVVTLSGHSNGLEIIA